MTATTRDEQETCSHCHAPRDPYDSVEGSYCSTLCYYRDRGDAVLSQIDSDHQLCSTCYGRVKTVEPAPRHAPECADGYQYPTPRTVFGVDDFSPDEYLSVKGTRWSCSCGAVDPNDEHHELRDVDRSEAWTNLFYGMVYLAERGAIKAAPSRERYVEALRERSHDYRYACGRAVYD